MYHLWDYIVLTNSSFKKSLIIDDTVIVLKSFCDKPIN